MRVFLIKGLNTTVIRGWAFEVGDRGRVLLLWRLPTDREYVWTSPELLRQEYGGLVTELSEANVDSCVPIDIWLKLEEALREMAEDVMVLRGEAAIYNRVARLTGHVSPV